MQVRRDSRKCETIMPEPMLIDDLIPSNNEIKKWIEQVCAPEHRRIGSSGSKASIEYIKGELENILGEENVEIQPFDIEFVYEATEHNLIIEDNDGKLNNFDCYYVLNTGMSKAKPTGGSVTGELVWAGAGLKEDFEELDKTIADYKDKIVVVQCTFPSFPLGILDAILHGFYYKSDPNDIVELSTAFPFTSGRSNFPTGDGDIPNDNSAYYQAKSRGAKALVLGMKDYPGDTNKYGAPYDRTLKKMPCLWVSGYDNEKLKAYADSGATATVTIKGTCEPGQGQNIFGILPGKSKETIMISTHHDSLFKGATEDGTGIAMVLAQAKAWAQVDPYLREKTILFVLADGHHYGGLGADLFDPKDGITIDGETFEVMKNLLVDINLEHLASKDYEVGADGELIDANRTAFNMAFITNNPVPIAATTRMLKNREPELTMAVNSTLLGDVPPGEVGHFHIAAGMDFIHWVAGPPYLLDDRDTMDKVDVDNLKFTAECASELVGSYMVLPEGYAYYK